MVLWRADAIHALPFLCASSHQEGDWGPLFTLLPEFLMSGAVQRAVQSAKDFEWVSWRWMLVVLLSVVVVRGDDEVARLWTNFLK